jgi:hypothetical protein
MERYLKKLHSEKADLESQLQGMLGGHSTPFDVQTPGKTVRHTQDQIAMLREKLKELDVVIKRESARKP